MSDNQDRMKFQSTTDATTKSVADTVAEVLSNSTPPKSRYEQQAELMSYKQEQEPLAEGMTSEDLETLKQDVANLFNKNEGKLPPALQKAIDAKKKGKDSDDEDDDEDVKEDNTNDKSDDGEGLDKVQPKAVKKKFKDRKDKDIDNDGDTDDSDKFLHKKRKAISKAMKKEQGSRLDGRNKTFKEKLRTLGYVKETKPGQPTNWKK